MMVSGYIWKHLLISVFSVLFRKMKYWHLFEQQLLEGIWEQKIFCHFVERDGLRYVYIIWDAVCTDEVQDLSFVTWNTAAVLHRKPPSTGTSHDGYCAQGCKNLLCIQQSCICSKWTLSTDLWYEHSTIYILCELLIYVFKSVVMSL